MSNSFPRLGRKGSKEKMSGIRLKYFILTLGEKELRYETSAIYYPI